MRTLAGDALKGQYEGGAVYLAGKAKLLLNSGSKICTKETKTHCLYQHVGSIKILAGTTYLRTQAE